MGKLKLDIVLIIALLAVMVGGFWMTGSALDERIEALDQKIQVVDTRVKEVMDKLIDVQNMVHAQKTAAAVAPAAAAPVAAAVPAGKPAKPAK
jgi:uncharacterized protein YdgA (DUF945 family)